MWFYLPTPRKTPFFSHGIWNEWMTLFVFFCFNNSMAILMSRRVNYFQIWYYTSITANTLTIVSTIAGLILVNRYLLFSLTARDSLILYIWFPFASIAGTAAGWILLGGFLHTATFYGVKRTLEVVNFAKQQEAWTPKARFLVWHTINYWLLYPVLITCCITSYLYKSSSTSSVIWQSLATLYLIGGSFPYAGIICIYLEYTDSFLFQHPELVALRMLWQIHTIVIAGLGILASFPTYINVLYLLAVLFLEWVLYFVVALLQLLGYGLREFGVWCKNQITVEDALQAPLV